MSRERRYALTAIEGPTNDPGLTQDAISGISYQVDSSGTRTPLGGGGGGSVSFLRANLNLTMDGQPTSSSGPIYWQPIIASPTGGPVVPSLPTKVDAGNAIVYINFNAPVGVEVTVDYVELIVANLDWTEALTVYTEAPVVVPAGGAYFPTAADFSGSYAPVGSDLSLFDFGGAGAIKTDAGGVFVAQMAFDIAVP